MKRFLIRGAIVLAPIVIIAALTLPRLGPWLVVRDPLVKSDAIVVLGGTRYERPLEAVDLYQEGWAPRVYLFRQVMDWGEAVLMERQIAYAREVDLQIDVMERLGVDRSHIGILDQANSTADEAGFLAELVSREKLRSVIIITSKQHTRRARLVMRRRLEPLGATVIMRPSRYDRSDVDRWWASRSTLRFTLFETQRLLGYWIGVAD